MQTVNFQCGHCNKLMAVSTDYLGQQVRCPHCQQVVVAPATAAPPPGAAVPRPAPMPLPPVPPPVFMDPTIEFNRGEQDSIFGPPEQSDDLFDEPPSPRMEMPAPPLFIPPQPPIPSVLSLTVPQPEAPAPAPDTAVFHESASIPSGPTALMGDSTTPFMAPSENGIPGLPNDGVSETATVPIPRPARQAKQGGNWVWFLLLPLMSYAILATILLIILAIKVINFKPPSLLDNLPDVNGDKPGAERQVGKPRSERATWKPDEKLTKATLPAHLKTSLGEPITVGFLEVTPMKVEQKKVSVFVEGFDKPQECQNASLVLHLRLRNVSREWIFAPLDNYFDRKYNPKTGDTKPLTLLEVGSKQFYGGPASWYPRERRADLRLNREWVEGRKNFDEDGLEPGQAIDSFVCTDGEDSKVLFAAADFEGTFVWRVHLRRGPVHIGGRDVPATAVVGVQFTPKDIVKVNE